jgi:hypothetical protein
MLAGEQDRYNNCCLIETARAIETAAKDREALDFVAAGIRSAASACCG